MQDLQPLAAIAALNLAAAMSPGPAFLLVTRTAASSSRRAAWATAAGTVTASVLWAAAALLGWQLVLARAAGIYRFLQITGGLYLCVIGWSTLRHAGDQLVATGRVEGSAIAGFRKGLVLGLSNPKVIVFFGTIFTTLFRPSTPAAVRWAALAIILFNESMWYGTLATVFGVPAVRRFYERSKASTERFFGSVLILFGARLAWNVIRE